MFPVYSTAPALVSDLYLTRTKLQLQDWGHPYYHYFTGCVVATPITITLQGLTRNKTQMAVVNILNLCILITWRFVCYATCIFKSGIKTITKSLYDCRVCYCHPYYYWGRGGGLVVSALNSGPSGPGSRPGWGHCVVFMDKALHSHCASIHPSVNLMLGVTLRWTSIPSRGTRNIPSRFMLQKPG